MILALMLGCMRPLPDPLAEQRAALATLAPPAAGWAPQATLEIGRDTLEQTVGSAIDGLLARGLAPTSFTMFGVTAGLQPSARVRAVSLQASAACADCLSLDVQIAGTATMRLANATGAREQALGFTSALQGVMRLSYDGARVLAGPAAADQWRATLAWDAAPSLVNQAFSATFTDALRQQLVLTDLPPVPVVTLRGASPVPVTALRLRSGPHALVLDLAFAIPTAGAVDRALDPQTGWALIVPQETALGLMQALSLSRSYDPEARATPELTALRVDDAGFALDLRAWPTHGRNRPRDLTVTGALGLDPQGDLFLRAEGARWLRERGDPPDLTTLLFGDALLEGLVGAMAANVPGSRAQGVGAWEMLATATRFHGVDGDLQIEGRLEAAPQPHIR